MEKFFENVKPGDFLELESRRGTMVKGTKYHNYHSLIVVGVDPENKTVNVFDANYVDKNVINNRIMSYDDFYKKYDGISAYHYWKYVD